MGRIRGVAVGIAGLALVAGCGGVQTTGEHKKAPAVAAVHAPEPSAAPPAVAARVRRTWLRFFDPKTSLQTREHLLQDGAKFAAVLRSLGPSLRSSHARVSVNGVQLSGQTAIVTYSATANGQTLPIAQPGEVIQQGGTWKVSDLTFCSLLAQEGATPPAACPTPSPPASPPPSPPAAHG